MEDEEYSTEYGIADILKALPEELSAELDSYIKSCTLQMLDEIDGAIGGMGQILQMLVMSEYGILQFGILLTVLRENDLVLADDAKEALSRVAENLRALSGHIELLTAPSTRH